MFQNRDEAARLLLKKLGAYKDKNVLVLGIPRGAVPMAKTIAEGLHGELSAVLVHKIPAPGYAELAIGSIGLSGKIFRNKGLITVYGIPESYVERAAAEELAVLKRRQAQFHLKDISYRDRIVMIVDDGIATGATVLGAIEEVKSQHPKEVVVVTAAIAHDTADKIRPQVDKLVSLVESDSFYAVSQYFVEFPQVTDEEVIKILHPSSYKEFSI
ncbi:phosphoribosyltransferase family protein [Bdellovibrio sp. 22V]|uniref:phosphoribosyltransferase n=1 Tax=Bdellovibrio sp. 22V TaxID=3044166 RepID=UPI0025432040|nr:phosphoribosyltransferase family protein [Bdellovibrio sp. 22V]WII73322.1 phosphoribosyltransferase family protein [Bdellovibrio sp. 22V]